MPLNFDPTGAGLRELLHHQPLLSFDHKGKPIDVRHENPDLLPHVVEEAEVTIKKSRIKKLKKKVTQQSDLEGLERDSPQNDSEDSDIGDK